MTRHRFISKVLFCYAFSSDHTTHVIETSAEIGTFWSKLDILELARAYLRRLFQ